MEQITLQGYMEIKNRIKDKLNETVNNFVIIGYYLKQVRDNALYIQDGYKNMEEFAMGEYKLSASTASRFMDINTKFTVDGNSLELKEEYRNFSYSKLQEMLTVRDEDLELITEDTTVKQIREIKAVEKAEEKAEEQKAQEQLPIIQMVEPKEEPVATSQEDAFNEVMIAFWSNKTQILQLVHNNMISAEDLAEELCPSGSKTFNHNIYMVFLYDVNVGIKVRHYSNGKPCIEQYSYDDWIEKTNEIITDEIYQSLIKPQPIPEAKPESVVTNPAPETEYQPLPGQMTTDDIKELQPDQEEDIEIVEIEDNPEVIEEQEKVPEVKPVAAELPRVESVAMSQEEKTAEPMTENKPIETTASVEATAPAAVEEESQIIDRQQIQGAIKYFGLERTNTQSLIAKKKERNESFESLQMHEQQLEIALTVMQAYKENMDVRTLTRAERHELARKAREGESKFDSNHPYRTILPKDMVEGTW